MNKKINTILTSLDDLINQEYGAVGSNTDYVFNIVGIKYWLEIQTHPKYQQKKLSKNVIFHLSDFIR